MSEHFTPELDFLRLVNGRVFTALSRMNFPMGDGAANIAAFARPSVLESKAAHLRNEAKVVQDEAAALRSNAAELTQLHQDRTAAEEHQDKLQLLRKELTEVQSQLFDDSSQPVVRIDLSRVTAELRARSEHFGPDLKAGVLNIADKVELASHSFGFKRTKVLKVIDLLGNGIEIVGREQAHMLGVTAGLQKKVDQARADARDQARHDRNAGMVSRYEVATRVVREIWANTLIEESLAAPENRHSFMSIEHPANFESASAFDMYVDQICEAAMLSLGPAAVNKRPGPQMDL